MFYEPLITRCLTDFDYAFLGMSDWDFIVKIKWFKFEFL